ncbi:dihydrofolate reductase [Chitinophaga alhagiae]|uniref:Dihydrofolate reductase n=1 Tax=Chitinophaga alhagiae TaxID=2203219 RepID=A0ABM6W8P2_9BACT|nr:dihydrofolate reductase [Chitinophaga alhagiae]AWO00284.1 dihydrofolate reductase [Chitinophaga alhagiae]
MTISIIVAASDNNVIGIENRLPWNLPADLQFFKNTTWGFPIIMGRKTFESMGRPLKGRQNIVITRQAGYSHAGITVVPSIEAAIRAAEEQDVNEIFITGGTEIFLQAFPLVDRIYLTRVHTTLQGDAFFPEISPEEWVRVHSEPHAADEKHAYAYTFERWERRQPAT